MRPRARTELPYGATWPSACRRGRVACVETPDRAASLALVKVIKALKLFVVAILIRVSLCTQQHVHTQLQWYP